MIDGIAGLSPAISAKILTFVSAFTKKIQAATSLAPFLRGFSLFLADSDFYPLLLIHLSSDWLR